MPQLSDLRESGAIEQDADMVIFIYRPETYEILTNADGESTKGETHIKIAKHRNGSLENLKLRALLNIQKFVQWDDDHNWKPGPAPVPGNDDGGKLYIQKGSKMNTGDFDEGFDGDAGF